MTRHFSCYDVLNILQKINKFDISFLLSKTTEIDSKVQKRNLKFCSHLKVCNKRIRSTRKRDGRLQERDQLIFESREKLNSEEKNA